MLTGSSVINPRLPEESPATASVTQGGNGEWIFTIKDTVLVVGEITGSSGSMFVQEVTGSQRVARFSLQGEQLWGKNAVPVTGGVVDIVRPPGIVCNGVFFLLFESTSGTGFGISIFDVNSFQIGSAKGIISKSDVAISVTCSLLGGIIVLAQQNPTGIWSNRVTYINNVDTSLSASPSIALANMAVPGSTGDVLGSISSLVSLDNWIGGVAYASGAGAGGTVPVSGYVIGVRYPYSILSETSASTSTPSSMLCPDNYALDTSSNPVICRSCGDSGCDPSGWAGLSYGWKVVVYVLAAVVGGVILGSLIVFIGKGFCTKKRWRDISDKYHTRDGSANSLGPGKKSFIIIIIIIIALFSKLVIPEFEFNSFFFLSSFHSSYLFIYFFNRLYG